MSEYNNLTMPTSDMHQCEGMKKGSCEKQGHLMVINAYRYIFSWLVPSIYLFGCIGTILCLIILVRKFKTQKEIRPWFIALSILDIYVLTMGVPFMYIRMIGAIVIQSNNKESNHTTYTLDVDPRNINKFVCYSFATLHLYGLLTSSWIQVGISVLRCLSTIIPLHARQRLNQKSSKIGLFLTLVIPMIVSIIVVVTTVSFDAESNSTKNTKCTSHRTDTAFYFYISIIMKVFVPYICLIVSTTAILYSLQKFKREFSQEGLSRSFQQRRISFILIGMNTTFLLLTLPYEVYGIYVTTNIQSFRSLDMGDLDVVMYLARLKLLEKCLNVLVYVNNATNWLFYFVLGKRFRQDLVHRLTCHKTKRSTIQIQWKNGTAKLQQQLIPKKPVEVGPKRHSKKMLTGQQANVRICGLQKNNKIQYNSGHIANQKVGSSSAPENSGSSSRQQHQKQQQELYGGYEGNNQMSNSGGVVAISTVENALTPSASTPALFNSCAERNNIIVDPQLIQHVNVQVNVKSRCHISKCHVNVHHLHVTASS